jgi:hypothetical protein
MSEQPPWNPQGPDAEIAAQEAELAAAAQAMYDQWLPQVADQLAPSPGIAPDPAVVTSAAAAAELEAAFASTVAPVIVGILGAQMVSSAAGALLDTATISSMPFVVDYIAQVRNRLVGVSDEVYADVRDAVADGILAGEGITAVAARIAAVLDPAAPTWSGRATVIARTEVIGARNAGNLAGHQAVASTTGEQLVKTWIATTKGQSGTRTRPTHLAAHGQEVHLDSPFTVGGYQLMYPGDPSGPAHEVIQCRCTMAVTAPGTVLPWSAEQTLTSGGTMTGPGLTAATTAPPPADPEESLPPPDGWRGVLCPLDVQSSDNRVIATPTEGTPLSRPLPLTLYYQGEVEHGHDGARPAGSIDRVWVEGNLVMGEGAFLEALPGAWNASDHLGADVGLGVSVDLGSTTEVVSWERPDGTPLTPADLEGDYQPGDPANPWTDPAGEPVYISTMTEWQIIAATMTGQPAFTEARVQPLWGYVRPAGMGYAPGVEPVVPVVESEPAPPLPVAEPAPAETPLIVPTPPPGPAPVPDLPALPAAGVPDFSDSAMVSLGISEADRARICQGPDIGPGEGPDGEPDGQHPGRMPIDQLHITLKYLGAASGLYAGDVSWMTSNLPQVADFISENTDDATVSVSGYGTLGPEGAAVMFLNGPILALANAQAAQQYGDVEGVPAPYVPYLPHITYGYGVDIATPPLAVGDTLTVTSLDLTVAGNRTSAQLACRKKKRGLTASAVEETPGFVPDNAWFTDPQLPGPTPLTVADDGRVYGHLATWGTCHTGMSSTCVTPPHSESGYGLFHTGTQVTSTGPVAVGRITLGTGHADIRLGMRAAAAHYDNTGAQVATVRAGEDAHGIWLAGALIPGTDTAKIEELRRSPLSGDWRTVGGTLELMGALAVNLPGFPVVRSDAGDRLAMVAAGMVPLSAPRPPVVDTIGESNGYSLDQIADAVARRMETRREYRARMDAANATVSTATLKARLANAVLATPKGR